MKKEKAHNAGFVNIVGLPNVGKSTLMNTLVGEQMSIITNKPQTTRHRIIGILNNDDYQVVFSDTPGYIDDPNYKMQEAMNKFVSSTFHDSDILLFVIDPKESSPENHPIFERVKKASSPTFLVINKIDTLSSNEILLHIKKWSEAHNFHEIVPISALNQTNVHRLIELIIRYLPEGQAYYPKDQLTDKAQRFFVSEIIRQNILQQYHQEIPYSTEVIIDQYKESKTKGDEEIVYIDATIYVMRQSQKPILIGKAGKAIKKLGMSSRIGIEKWLDSKVHLQLHVKVSDDWRNDDRMLRHFGYHS